MFNTITNLENLIIYGKGIFNGELDIYVIIFMTTLDMLYGHIWQFPAYNKVVLEKCYIN